MQQTTFTVIIATHRRPALLRRAITSLKAQQLPCQQIVVVSDVNDPDTYAVTSELLGPGDAFVQRCSAPGPAESRNLALKLAREEHVLFLDDDDSFRPNFLHEVAQHINGGDRTAIQYTNFEVVDPSTEPQTWAIDLAPINPVQVWVKNFIPNNCLIYPRELLGKVQFDAHVAYEDWDFVLAAHSLVPLNHLPIYGPVVHKNAAEVHRGSENNSKLLECYLRIYAKFPPHSAMVVSMRRALFESVGLEIDKWVSNAVAEGVVV